MKPVVVMRGLALAVAVACGFGCSSQRDKQPAPAGGQASAPGAGATSRPVLDPAAVGADAAVAAVAGADPSATGAGDAGGLAKAKRNQPDPLAALSDLDKLQVLAVLSNDPSQNQDFNQLGPSPRPSPPIGLQRSPSPAAPEVLPKAIVTLQSADVVAGVAADARASLSRRLGAARICYLRLLKVNPSPAGTLTIHLTTDADGLVQVAQIESAEVNDAQLFSCLREGLRRIKFSTGGASAKLDVRLVLSSGP